MATSKDVCTELKITPGTLSNWVKMGWIEVEKTPSGRYIYIEKN